MVASAIQEMTGSGGGPRVGEEEEDELGAGGTDTLGSAGKGRACTE